MADLLPRYFPYSPGVVPHVGDQAVKRPAANSGESVLRLYGRAASHARDELGERSGDKHCYRVEVTAYGGKPETLRFDEGRPAPAERIEYDGKLSRGSQDTTDLGERRVSGWSAVLGHQPFDQVHQFGATAGLAGVID